jgi:LysM repeat protein
MMKKSLYLFLIFIFILIAIPPQNVDAAPRLSGRPEVKFDAYSLIAEVNALRAANGLTAYTISPILMATAQAHAEYMASTGDVSHIGAGGSNATQRLLGAGYPLAGNLAAGGMRSENITAGNNKTEQQAVLEWQGDAPHLNTMLSANLQEIGAGVAVVGDRYYYVIDCARPTTSGLPQSSSSVTGGVEEFSGVDAAPLASSITASTPNADGNLIHTVQPGETLWLIAVSYKVKIAEIRQLNNMAETDAIYPGEKLLILQGIEITPQVPTPSETAVPPVMTSTIAVTQPVIILTFSTPTPEKIQNAATSGLSGKNVWIMAVIVIAAMLLAGLITILSAQKPR